jgi:hypothetical protein
MKTFSAVNMTIPNQPNFVSIDLLEDGTPVIAHQLVTTEYEPLIQAAFKLLESEKIEEAKTFLEAKGFNVSISENKPLMNFVINFGENGTPSVAPFDPNSKSVWFEDYHPEIGKTYNGRLNRANKPVANLPQKSMANLAKINALGAQVRLKENGFSAVIFQIPTVYGRGEGKALAEQTGFATLDDAKSWCEEQLERFLLEF